MTSSRKTDEWIQKRVWSRVWRLVNDLILVQTTAQISVGVREQVRVRAIRPIYDRVNVHVWSLVGAQAKEEIDDLE
jgi:hypothetical protein